MSSFFMYPLSKGKGIGYLILFPVDIIKLKQGILNITNVLS